MVIENISPDNLTQLAQLMVELWPDASFDEELENCNAILTSDLDTCLLARTASDYIGFIQASLRKDYVEGADSSPVAYIEGIYVKASHRHLRVGKSLVEAAAEWGKKNGCLQMGSDTELENTQSIGFHKNNGFTEANRIVCFIKNL